MGILGDDDVDMENIADSTKKKGRKSVKDAAMKETVASLSKKSKQINKKPEKVGRKEKLNQLSVNRNLRWMKAVKNVSEKPDLTPVQQELLSQLVGRTCLPQHKKQFVVFVQKSLKLKKEKYSEIVEDLFSLLKKSMQKISQTPELRAAAEVPFKPKEKTVKEKKKATENIDKSKLTKSQRKRMKKKERVIAARERDGVFDAKKSKKAKKETGHPGKKSKKPKKSPGKQKAHGKKKSKK